MRPPILLAAVAIAFAGRSLVAQDIPPYVPANPVLTSRSALYAQPFIAPHRGWQFRLVSDYYNAVEVAQSADVPTRQSVFDAEVLEADLWATRDISRHLFLVANLPLRGGYAGVLDPFLNWYHNVIGLQVPARNLLPSDQFQWTIGLPDTTIVRERPGTFVGDLRMGVGLRFGRAQLVATVTLPTGSLGDEGWTRKVVATSLALTAELARTSRVALDAGITGGFTPTHGARAQYQESAFAGGLVSGRWRFAGRQSVFGTLWAQSSNWKNTGFVSMDDAEVSLDFGFLLHVRRNWPELQLGMTQDVVPKGPAMDVGFTIGLRW